MSNSVGTIIRVAREGLGLSQREFVGMIDKTYKNKEKNHISRSHLSDVETGRRSISLDKLNLVTDALIRFGAN